MGLCPQGRISVALRRYVKGGKQSAITLRRGEKMICMLCGEEFDRVSGMHLKSAHNVDVFEYRRMFPNAITMSEENRQSMGEAHKGNQYALGNVHTEETRQAMREAVTGNQYFLGHVHTGETKQAMRESMKEQWKDPEFQQRWSKSVHMKPNGPERQLQSVLDKHSPGEWKYTGDGTFWIEGKNPDFTNVNSKKQVIEIFGYYWHDPNLFPNRMSEEELIAHYKEYGFNCIIFWEFDVYNEEEVIERIKQLFT